MDTYTLEQFNRFDECATSVLNRLNPFRLIVTRKRIGNTVIFDLVDTQSNSLWARYELKRLPNGNVQHGLVLRDNDLAVRDSLLAKLTDEMRDVSHHFVLQVAETDFVDVDRVIRGLFDGTVDDVARFIKIHTGEGKRYDVYVIGEENYEGATVVLWLSTRQQFEEQRQKKRPDDSGWIHLEGIGCVFIERVNNHKSRFVIFPATSDCEQFAKYLIEKMGNEGLIDAEPRNDDKPKLSTPMSHRGGRPRNPDDDWAYKQLSQGRHQSEVFAEWLTRIGARAATLADPLDSFNKAVRARRREKREEME